jgi:DnaJ-class molecular chaperone
MNYWKECIEEAFDDAGISATEEQINTVADWVKGAHDNYGMAFGHDCISNPLENENKRLTQELKKEKNKTICDKCNGKGSITTHGPCHSATSLCYKCNGDGRV